MTDNIARKHHYLPRSYLSGFTTSGRKNGSLYVFDLDLGKVVGPKSVKGIAFEPDWHAIRGPGTPPDYFEKLLGTLEDKVSHCIRRVVSSLEITDDDRNTLINFIALTTVRVPRFRAGIIQYVETRIGKPFEEAVACPASWEYMMDIMPADGWGWANEDRELFLALSQPALANSENFHLLSLTTTSSGVLELLSSRNWSLYVAEENAGELICSDNPVSLMHSPPRDPIVTPWFGDTDSILTFPLTKKMALVGKYATEENMKPMSRDLVTNINIGTLSEAQRYLYGPNRDLLQLMANWWSR